MTKKKKNKKWLLVLSLILLLTLTLSYYFYNTHPVNKTFQQDSNAVGYDPKLKKPKNFKSSQIALPGFSEIEVNEGDTKSHSALSNPSFNKVYFKYTVIFNNTKETLLTTDAIPPGKAVIGFPIPKNLKAGTYPITIKIDTYDMKSKQSLNGGQSLVNLVVKNKS